jgi:hypothetical protein
LVLTIHLIPTPLPQEAGFSSLRHGFCEANSEAGIIFAARLKFFTQINRGDTKNREVEVEGPNEW